MVEKQKTHKGIKGEDEGMSAARSSSDVRKKDDGSGGMQKNMLTVSMILGVLILIAAISNAFLTMQLQEQNNKIATAIADNTDAIKNLASSGVNNNVQNQVTPTTVESQTTGTTVSGNPNQKVSVIVLNDKRCTACVSTGDSIVTQLKTVFKNLDSTNVDYSTVEGKRMYTESNLKALPAILFTTDVKTATGYSDVSQYLTPAGNYLSLGIGADYDPTCYKADGTIDCSIPACASRDVSCSLKAKPTVELFVMAYCPYGTQIEKGILPTIKALGNTVDFAVKFCDYSMHGEKEVDEEMTQYCIETQQSDKYQAYLGCFLQAGNSTDCLKSTGIDTTKLATCVSQTDSQYKVTASFNDKSTWIGGNYPPFAVYESDNKKYNVQGSPTLVINGVTTSASRDSKSLLDAICKGFTTKPAACSQKLSTAAPAPGFGTTTDTTGTASSAGGCATA